MGSICKTRATFTSPWKRINLGVESLLHYCVLFGGIIRVIHNIRIFSFREFARCSCISVCMLHRCLQGECFARQQGYDSISELLIKLCVRSSCFFLFLFFGIYWKLVYIYSVYLINYWWMFYKLKSIAYENLLHVCYSFKK